MLEDLPDFPLVLNADILNNEISPWLHIADRWVTYQTLGTHIYVRIVETRIAHGWGVDQGGDFSEMLSAEPVEHADVRIFELREELDDTTQSTSLVPSQKHHVKHSQYTSQAMRLWSVTAPGHAGSESLHRRREVVDPSRSVGNRNCSGLCARSGVYPSVEECNI